MNRLPDSLFYFHTMYSQLIHTILMPYQVPLGDDFEKYYNHACRVYQYAVWLSKADIEAQKQLAIAAAFHDLGIWTEQTFDYLSPSVHLAKSYLIQNDLADWASSIEEIIVQHHKLRPYHINPLAEYFRQADLIDLYFGLFQFGLSRGQINAAVQQFPYGGFHRFLAKECFKNILRHPLHPLPMMRW